MSSYAKHRMSELCNNQFRPEQIQLYQSLRKERPENQILMEYTVTYSTEQNKIKTAIGDIVDITKHEFIRINGLYHNSSMQEEKDWEQKLYLEKLGWKVIDIEG